MSRQGIQYLMEMNAVSVLPRHNRAVSQTKIRVRYYQLRIKDRHSAQTAAFRAGPLRTVKGKTRRCYLGITYVTLNTRSPFAEKERFLAFHIDCHQPVGLSHGQFKGIS